MHYPEHMMLEVTAKCNFRCPYCYTKYYDRKEQPMKPFARINLSSVLSSVALAKVDALRGWIFVSSLAREGRGKAKGETR